MLAHHSLLCKIWQRQNPARCTAKAGAQRALLRISFGQVQRRTFACDAHNRVAAIRMARSICFPPFVMMIVLKRQSGRLLAS